MRPLLSAILAATLCGVIIFSAFVSLAQEKPETKRKIVYQMVPAYPELARQMHLSGTVKVEIKVAPNGSVKSVEVVGGSPLLARASIDAVQTWKWEPAPQESKEFVQLNFHP